MSLMRPSRLCCESVRKMSVASYRYLRLMYLGARSVSQPARGKSAHDVLANVPDEQRDVEEKGDIAKADQEEDCKAGMQRHFWQHKLVGARAKVDGVDVVRLEIRVHDELHAR